MIVRGKNLSNRIQTLQQLRADIILLMLVTVMIRMGRSVLFAVSKTRGLMSCLLLLIR